jgi:glutaconate CoA-transferase subunit B
VTDLCQLEPDSGELVVTSLHPGVSRADVEAATGWPVRFARSLDQTPAPTAEELDVLRDLHRRTDEAHAS